MELSEKVKEPKLQLTAQCFAEFATASKRATNSLDKAETQRSVTGSGVAVAVKRGKGISLAKLSRPQRCQWCGERYNGSTAPIVPAEYCSRGCEETADSGVEE